MIKDLPEGTTHSYNDGCGIKEHNMTFKDGFCEFLGTNTTDDESIADVSDKVFDWFLAQFDAMLAADIEKMKTLFHEVESPEEVTCTLICKNILEARRLSLKK